MLRAGSRAGAKPSRYERRVLEALAELKIPPDLPRQRGLRLCPEGSALVVAEVDARGREQRLVPAAATAWRGMKAAAAEADVALHLVSAFRSFEQQCEIVRAKLAAGQLLERILEVSAPPGYSEHHTGRAVDIGAFVNDPLDEAFDATAAHAWLTRNAARYGFALSYPRGNRYGYRYEPWHWLYEASGVRAGSRRIIGGEKRAHAKENG
jgi:D-alanyl-D-alanine carboxypeptidase